MKIHAHFHVLFLAVAIVFIGTAAAAPAIAHATTDAAAEQKTVAFLRSEMRERQIPGLQIVVIKHQKLDPNNTHASAHLAKLTIHEPGSVLPIHQF